VTDGWNCNGTESDEWTYANSKCNKIPDWGKTNHSDWVDQSLKRTCTLSTPICSPYAGQGNENAVGLEGPDGNVGVEARTKFSSFDDRGKKTQKYELANARSALSEIASLRLFSLFASVVDCQKQSRREMKCIAYQTNRSSQLVQTITALWAGAMTRVYGTP